MKNIEENENNAGIARSLLVINQFEQLCRTAEGVCNIVPLKGISLLLTLYNQRFDREVGDIDLLVFPSEKVGDFIERLRENGRYRLQFSFLREKKSLQAKQKIAMCPTVTTLTDVDIHTSFVTKKFFRLSCKRFDKDVLSRCRHVSRNVYYMDCADQWLFLAQHACFHQYSDTKWLRDLSLLMGDMSQAEVETVRARASEYGFNRILHSALKQLGYKCELSSLGMRRCLKFADWCLALKHKGKIYDKFVTPFWEFVFIDRCRKRLYAYWRLLFPSLHMIKNIYRLDGTALAAAVYPFHSLLALVGLLGFAAIYHYVVFVKSR